MGNGYKNHHLHPQTLYQKNSFFLPMLCRLSLKDVTLSSSHYNNNNKNRSSSKTTIDEPSLSPKVSCMGQVKRKNNKVIGFPSSSSSSSANTTPSNQIKYTKLKKLFSSKNLINGGGFSTTAAFNGGGFLTTAAFNGGGGGSKSCVSSKEMMRLKGVGKQQEMMMMRSINGDDLNVCELDPPLPVIKKVQEPGAGRDEINIWKRRFNGDGIKGLQINNNNFLPPPPTTV